MKTFVTFITGMAFALMLLLAYDTTLSGTTTDIGFIVGALSTCLMVLGIVVFDAAEIKFCDYVQGRKDRNIRRLIAKIANRR